MKLIFYLNCRLQKQPFRGVLGKTYSENIQQIYRRIPMPKCDLNKVAKELYWNGTSAWLFSCKFAAYSQNIFSKNTSGGLILRLTFTFAWSTSTNRKVAVFYLLKVNNTNIWTRCEICSKLTIKTPWCRSGVFIVNFEHISHLVLMFLSLIFSR